MTTMAISGWWIVAVLLSQLLCSVTAFDVVIGAYMTCALNQSEIKCWGYHAHGELGLDHTTDILEPLDTPIDLGDDFVPKTAECANYFCCSVSEAGGLKCWGTNWYGNLGYGDTEHRGDDANEMGNNLALVNLGTGFVVDHIAVSGYSVCAISTEGDIKCWGDNRAGQLGYGDTDYRGDASDEMGDNLGNVDLGDFDAVKLIRGGSRVCALSDEGYVKCWGVGLRGELGQGDANNRGDQQDEMGDFLLPIDFGTGFVVSSMGCGSNHCCVLNAEHDFKCWGYAYGGALGYGDLDNRGDGTGEMGDYLQTVDVGTGFIVDDFTTSYQSTCVHDTEIGIKCFGYNSQGQLGYGDTNNRGDGSNEMGDNLQIVDVGSEFTASGIHLVGAGNVQHYCVYEENESDLGVLVKCWGRNNRGQLGYGDNDNHGDGINEMGANLPLLDLGTWPVVATNAPTTDAPSSVPTSAPSVSPTTGLPTTAAPMTMDPTKVPTMEPTVSPTVQPTLSPTVKPTAQPSAEPTKEPTRDCSVFHIDEFLMDCSDEFDSHGAHIDTLNSDVASIKDELSGNALDIGDLTETVSKLVNATTTTIASINAINAEIQVIMEQLDRMGDYP